jgi:hypothetical protein
MSKDIIPIERVAHAISVRRNQRVILDYDLAVLYGVEARALKQPVRPNPEKPRRESGFQVRESATRYRVRKRA